MMKDDYAANLRHQAEALLNRRDSVWNADTAADISAMLEELEVHRIELQIQNDSLQDAYDQLEAERTKYANLFNNMPIGYLHLDINGFIHEANQFGCKLLRTPYKKLLGKRLADFIYPQDQQRFHMHLHRVFVENAAQRDDLSIVHADSSLSYLQLISHPFTTEAPQACHVLLNDITDLKRHIIEQALQETALLLTSALDVATVLRRILQFVTRIVPCDMTFVALWDEQRQSLLVAQVYGNNEPDMLENLEIPFTPTLRKVREGGEPYLMVYKAEQKSWPELVVNKLLHSYIVTPLIIRDEFLGFLWVGSHDARYFTSHHLQDLGMFARQAALAVNNARQHKQSQTLATMSERQRIARELHDAVKQNLFSAALIAANLTQNQQEFSKETSEHHRYLHETLQAALAEMRILLDELQPDHILELPDDKMLKSLSQRLLKADIKVSLKTHLEAPLPLDIKITIYRILQEALTNILHHANAHHVHIKLNRTANQIDLSIKDDGTGFDTSTVLEGYGLKNIYQRVNSSNGNIDIQSHVGKGTQITVSWKLAAAV